MKWRFWEVDRAEDRTVLSDLVLVDCTNEIVRAIYAAAQQHPNGDAGRRRDADAARARLATLRANLRVKSELKRE